VTVMFWPVIVFMALSLAVGLYTYTQVRGSSHRFAVCGKAMPFFIIGTALLAQAVDGNATLGNVALTYSSSIWTGLMIPVGLAASLLFVGRFLAAPLNRMNLLTLPEYFFRRYGRNTELLVSILTICCFTVLIAGNLSAVAWIVSVATGWSYTSSLCVSTAVIVAYTMAGGLYSAIWTDLFQIHVALIGFIASAIFVVAYYGWDNLLAGVPATILSLDGMTKMSSGALPNWAGTIALAFGNAMALDFMERVFAAKSPDTARNGCYYAATLTMVIGLFASILGIAGIALVKNTGDPRMVLPLLASGHIPFWMGAMVFLGVLGASMSTANGAMLVISLVLTQNIVVRWRKQPLGDSAALLITRAMAIPTAALAALLAYLRPEPGILLVIAFDIVFAGCVAPLVLGVHWRKANAPAAVSAILAGTGARVAAHFLTPAAWAGLDTLIPPAISLATFWTVCTLTQGRETATAPADSLELA
jgi:solute:Na+ symporter, SSS family